MKEFTGDKITGTFYDQKLQESNQSKLRIKKKMIKKTDNKLYIKWKKYNNLFISLIDVRCIIKYDSMFPEDI